METELPNDGITIQKQYEPNTLQALSVIKAVCQINGAFGIINRNGQFEYRILGAIEEPGAYPSETLFPGPDVFPGLAQSSGGYNEVAATDFAFYRKVDYEEYSVKPVDKLTIRQTENDAGVTYGTGTNNYIIQGNMFTCSGTLFQNINLRLQICNKFRLIFLSLCTVRIFQRLYAGKFPI